MDEEQLEAMSAEIGDGLGLEDGEDKDAKPDSKQGDSKDKPKE